MPPDGVLFQSELHSNSATDILELGASGRNRPVPILNFQELAPVPWLGLRVVTVPTWNAVTICTAGHASSSRPCSRRSISCAAAPPQKSIGGLEPGRLPGPFDLGRRHRGHHRCQSIGVTFIRRRSISLRCPHIALSTADETGSRDRLSAST